MGYCLNCLDEPVLMAVPKPMQTEFGIHHRLESCVLHLLRLFVLISPKHFIPEEEFYSFSA